ncbi:agmatinase [Salinicoccus kekensis]|uniref:Agmatinase n=1 Tax=Salinicoccus kekensis TaxID=714307 RepID=A0A285UJ65_9STAP|nr:agmatinase [Salinicoccus kekensis]SOC40646.1 agmatinase [Salinicoccus kekensis]
MSSRDMLAYAGHATFWGLPPSREAEGRDITVMGVPFELGLTRRPGARFGPRSIREASVHDMSMHYPWPYDVKEDNDLIDYGDVGYDLGETRLNYMLEESYKHARKIFSGGSKLLTIGGDHTVAYSTIRAAKEKYGKLSLLHIDSHQESLPGGSGKISRNSFAHDLAEEGAIDPGASVQAYVRTSMPKDFEYNIIHAKEAMAQGPEALAEKVKSVIGDNPVYLSFDIDALDPAFAPGTATPVPGGPSTTEMRLFLEHLAGLNIVAADLVEVTPSYDSGEMTAVAAASIGKDLLHLLAENND